MRGQLQKLLLLSLIWIRLQASYGRPGHLSSDGRQLLQRLDLRQIQKGPPLAPKQWERTEALNTPVVVATMTGHYFGEYVRTVPDCYYEGTKIGCEFTMSNTADTADALWYHAPHACWQTGNFQRKHPSQLLVVMSMESASYYGCLDDVKYMDQFDIEMTYRRCSHVPITYFDGSYDWLVNKLFSDPVPFEEKVSAVAYINSNCAAPSNRNGIVQEIMSDGRMEVHAWGTCLRNKVPPDGRGNKYQIMRKYKFCVAMENSASQDYVTEKLWQAMEAGCLPIYYGPVNTPDIAPTPNSILDWRDFSGNVKGLVDRLVYLSNNKTAYLETMAWRYSPQEALSPGFRKHLATTGNDSPHTQCQLCQLIMGNRIKPQNFTKTHCLRNETWLKVKEKHHTSWGPGSDALLDRLKDRKWPNGMWDPTKWAPVGMPRAQAPASHHHHRRSLLSIRGMRGPVSQAALERSRRAEREWEARWEHDQMLYRLDLEG